MDRCQRLKMPLILIILVMLFCLLPALPAQASVMGEQIDGYEAVSAGGVQLTRNIFWTGSDYRTENYLVYDGESQVFPVVVYGSKVLNYGNFSSMAALLENQGYTVLGGINGDYYNTADYQPLGIVVTDGILRSSDGGHYAIGFYDDGSAIMGKPAMRMSIFIDGNEYTLGAVNKTRGSQYFVLLTEDYSYTTRTTTPGRNAILTIVDGGELTTNCTLTLEVQEIIHTSEPISLQEGELILTLADDAPAWSQSGMDALEEGDTITIDISCADGWEDVEYAIGSLYKLVTNGVVESGLDNSSAPRTAVGLKPNGEVILYTIDGRQSGHSVGANMYQVANRLIELGCTEATLLDGGGSTTLNAVYGGESSISQINNPSDGSQRSVTNYIMLVSTARGSGDAAQLTLYPLSLNILSGAQTQFYALAMDEYGLAAAVPSNLYYSVDSSLGSVDANGLFIASSSNNTTGTLDVSAPGVESAEVTVRVIADPDSITVKNAATDASLTTLEIQTGQSIDLDATALYNHLELVADDSCFQWQVSGDIGTIDNNGVFTASVAQGSGQIIITAGDTSFSLPVTVKRNYTFDDVLPTSWYFDAVEFVASEGLFNGTSSTSFTPDGNMNRAMIVTVLYRLAGSPAVTGEVAFNDVASGLWYSSAVIWADANGIVEGFGDGRFAPLQNVTREEIACFIYRYAAFAGQDISAAADLSSYTDTSSIHDWALSAMQWAVSEEIITGRPSGALDPRGFATRAEVATMMMRFLS